ncbi:MAG TPA: D-glycero-beta-D-manno-heptose 1-phosphate adenylyltransferase, partial [Roseiflexaceae bacterium]|nr:D-glycero-beta-D-manno-heptose 1-phosphate adenylyltransferase [Roseiflexaceae bacterium]
FGSLDVLVIGDAMLDCYLAGAAGELCREAPVPIVKVTERVAMPGGAANTALNVRSLGARVTLLSAIGDDAEGRRLHSILAERDVATEHVLMRPDRQTLAKNRVLAAEQLLVRFDQGSTSAVDQAAERALIERMAVLFPRCAAVIVSDYGYGILTPRIIAALAMLQARCPRIVVADSKDLAAFRAVGLTAAKPNYAECLRLLGASAGEDRATRAEWIAGRGAQLLDITGARMVATTLDAEGAIIVEREGPPYRTYARPTRDTNAAGAGDTFLSALALALAAGADTPAAAEIAAAAATVVVGKPGTATCATAELRGAFAGESKYATDLARLIARVEEYRRQGCRIVFTNGCFDILHRGHITYLNRAKALGDILIVGMNTDDSVRRLKGLQRPINSLEDRAQVLAALSCVDELIAFDDETPIRLIRALRPDVFVKGGDYTRASLPEAPVVEQLGGRVEILPYLHHRSTTNLIERIRLVPAVGELHEQPADFGRELERTVGS